MAANPYEVLGLDSTASTEEARGAYRRLAEIYHPDRYQDSRPEVREEAAQRMRELNEAWAAIKSGRAGDSGSASGSSGAQGPESSSAEPSMPQPKPKTTPSPPPTRRRLDPLEVSVLAVVAAVVVVALVVTVAGGGDSSPDDAGSAAPANASPAAPASNRSTATSSTTTTTEAPEPETRQTVPGPPEPSAPWATGAVAATGDLVDVVVGWNGARSFDDPWQCGLYAPTELGTQVGLVSSFLPQATRIGDFQFGWDDGAGGSMVLVSIWPADNPNVERFFADPAPTVYADGSETRQDPTGSALLSDTLISIPGEPCHYEVSCDTTVSCSWAFDSFREIAT